jgi:PTH1 family peptidyl-tRNA hydrolase
MALGRFIQRRTGQTGPASADRPAEKQLRLIVGLGNPGREHAGSRHNMGFEVVDLLAELLGVAVRRRKFGSLVGEAGHGDKKLILVKPQEFMNRSGQAVRAAVDFYRLAPGSLLVIMDDMALEPGRIRIRASGSAGGHNGLADVIEKLGTTQVARLRVGIGAAPGPEWRDWVLSKPSPEERKLLETGALKARDAALCWVDKGIAAAMNIFNAPADTGGKR